MQASTTYIEMKMNEECDEKLKRRVEDYKGENRGCTLIFKRVAGSAVALTYSLRVNLQWQLNSVEN